MDKKRNLHFRCYRVSETLNYITLYICISSIKTCLFSNIWKQIHSFTHVGFYLGHVIWSQGLLYFHKLRSTSKTGWGGMDWIHMAWSRGLVEASCEHSNELSAFVKYWKILRVAERLTASREGLISTSLWVWNPVSHI